MDTFSLHLLEITDGEILRMYVRCIEKYMKVAFEYLYLMLNRNSLNIKSKATIMKYSKKSLQKKYFALPVINFEQQRLTSFSGLIIFQKLFQIIKLKQRLRKCFAHIKIHPVYGFQNIIILLIVHILLGFRRIKDLVYYAHDPMVKRIIGVSRLPDASNISRILGRADDKSMTNCRMMLKYFVLEQLLKQRMNRVTADFDGSVIFTKRYAENSAVGYNKKKKGLRSYYPLFCTVAQTGQVLDFHHRPGNVHDSNGSIEFVETCYRSLWEEIPNVKIESRLDAAFFSRQMVDKLYEWNAEFSISVPFLRLTELKGKVENRQRWIPIDEDISFFEEVWKPNKWLRKYRFIFVRRLQKKQYKEALQLDMFLPNEYEYQYSVITTNKTTHAKNVIAFHNGRGSQEGIFGELKEQGNMDYIPFKRLLPNQFYLFCCTLAHNLSRELQMRVLPQKRSTSYKRAAHWVFNQMKTIRKNLVVRAGRFTRPQGNLTLTVSGNEHVESEFDLYLDKLKKAA